MFAKCYLVYVIQYTKAPMTFFKVLNLITFDQFCFKKKSHPIYNNALSKTVVKRFANHSLICYACGRSEL